MPEKYCSVLLNFTGNIPDKVAFNLDKATERFQADLREDRYGKKGAFFDAIAQSTRFARRAKSATPDSASISMPAIGKEVFRLWKDESEPTARGINQAIETLSNRITKKTGVPHPHASHETKVEHLSALPPEHGQLSDTPFYSTAPSWTSVQFDKFVPESELTNAVIKSRSNQPDPVFIPEKHYADYGKRGSVDLFAQDVHLDEDIPSSCRTYVIEMKSGGAIKNVTGPNEIIQQFNKMREHFFSGIDSDNFEATGDSVKFELAFTPSKKCIRHILDFDAMYRSAVSEQLGSVDDMWPEERRRAGDQPSIYETVSIRLPDPDNSISIDVFRGREGPDPAEIEQYKRYLLKKSPRFYDEFHEVFEEHQ
ncbi:hypothetical protein [Halobacterium salinarum]|uniref:hypothetical protein n=1 Tax=Halobacterium salinarum TaxID=2242 RepID=UPI0025557731|nr:hypothetical protein [Halobacterium salinarum]MDL0122825.1 hypothetical protein [Halobacterium salinarum]